MSDTNKPSDDSSSAENSPSTSHGAAAKPDMKTLMQDNRVRGIAGIAAIAVIWAVIAQSSAGSRADRIDMIEGQLA
ncbi:MAG: kinesin, partial [Halomonas sp.]